MVNDLDAARADVARHRIRIVQFMERVQAGRTTNALLEALRAAEVALSASAYALAAATGNALLYEIEHAPSPERRGRDAATGKAKTKPCQRENQKPRG